MEKAIRALLKADAAIAAQCAGRVEFGAQPQGGPLPAVTLNVVSDISSYTLDGPGGLFEARIQVDCYGDRYEEAKELSRAVLTALSGHRGGALKGVFHINSRDTRDTDAVGDPACRVSMDFHVHYHK